MRRIIFIISIFILLTVGFLGAAHLTAVSEGTVYAIQTLDPSLCDDPNNRPGVCDEVDSNKSATDNVLVGPDGIITNIIDALSYVVGIISLIMIIIGGFMYIFSGGNPESAARATKTVLYAVIGLVVALSAQAIVIFVLSQL